MATNPFFSGRIPQKLFDAIEDHRKASGESKTDILIKALSAYVNTPVEVRQEYEAVNIKRLEALESRMEAIERLMVEEHLGFASTHSDLQPASNGDTSNNQMSIYDVQPLEIPEGNQITNATLPVIDNESDNDIDNETKEDLQNDILPQEEKPIGLPSGEWEYLGEMRSTDIMKLKELQMLDAKKLKNKIANTNVSKNKEVLVEPFFWRIDRQEPGDRGKLTFKVYQRKT